MKAAAFDSIYSAATRGGGQAGLYAGGWAPEQQPRTRSRSARAEFQKRNRVRQEEPVKLRRGVDRDRVCTENRFRFKGKGGWEGGKRAGQDVCVVQNRKVMRCPRFAWVFVLSFSFMLGLRVSVQKDF